MISSRKIDLTENRDFMSHGIDVTVALNSENIRRAVAAEEEDLMSTDEFLMIQLLEKTFGVRRHMNQFYEVFKHKEDDEWEYEMKTHCQRCGKPLRIPWRDYSDVCVECDEEMRSTSDYLKYPWKREVTVSFGNNDARRIFNLR